MLLRVEKRKFYTFKQYIGDMLSSKSSEKSSVWPPSIDNIQQCIFRSRERLVKAL